MPQQPKPPTQSKPNWVMANFYWAGVVACAAIIISLNTLPGSSIPSKHFFSNVPNFDKFVHFHMYLGLMFLVWNASVFTMESLRKTSIPKILLLFPFGFAILDELLQYPVPGRTTDPLDLLADWCGAGFVLALAYAKSKYKRRNRR